MHAVYLTTNGDTTTFLSTPLEVQGYGCGIIELDGKVIIPKRLMKNKPKPMPSPPMTPTDEEGKIPPRERAEKTNRFNKIIIMMVSLIIYISVLI